MAWTDLEFDFGSILTSSKMTNLQANFQAMADGDSGAPAIQAEAIDSNVVSIDKCDSGVVIMGDGGSSGESNDSTSYGGGYSFKYYNNGSATTLYYTYVLNGSTTPSGKVSANGTDSESTSSGTKTGSISLSGQSSGWNTVTFQGKGSGVSPTSTITSPSIYIV